MMNPDKGGPSHLRFSALLGIWLVCVAASVVAAWVVGKWFGMEFHPAVMVLLSTAAAIAVLLQRTRRP